MKKMAVHEKQSFSWNCIDGLNQKLPMIDAGQAAIDRFSSKQRS